MVRNNAPRLEERQEHLPRYLLEMCSIAVLLICKLPHVDYETTMSGRVRSRGGVKPWYCPLSQYLALIGDDDDPACSGRLSSHQSSVARDDFLGGRI
jgi:hypothetical protein